MTSAAKDPAVSKRGLFLWEQVDKPKAAASASTIYECTPTPKTDLGGFGGTVPPIPKHLFAEGRLCLEQLKSEQNKKLTRRALTNPLVPLGMIATTGCLIGMCYTCMKRDRMKTQYFMRGRIAAQFFTFCMLFGGAWYLGIRDGSIPNKINM